jgi:hypothetical protein
MSKAHSSTDNSLVGSIVGTWRLVATKARDDAGKDLPALMVRRQWASSCSSLMDA